MKRFEEIEELGGDVAPSTFLSELTDGKNVSHEATKPRGCSNAALIQVF